MKNLKMEFAKFLHENIGVNIVKDFGHMNWDFDYNNVTGTMTISFSPLLGIASILETEDKILTLHYLSEGTIPFFALSWDISQTLMMYPERISEIEMNLGRAAYRNSASFTIGSELVQEYTIAQAKDRGLMELIEKSWFGNFYLGKELLFDPSISVDDEEEGCEGSALEDFLLLKQKEHIAGVSEWAKLPEKERRIKETERGYRTRALGIMEQFIGTNFDSPEDFCDDAIIDELMAQKNVGPRVLQEIKDILREEGYETSWDMTDVKCRFKKKKNKATRSYKKRRRGQAE